MSSQPSPTTLTSSSLLFQKLFPKYKSINVAKLRLIHTQSKNTLQYVENIREELMVVEKAYVSQRAELRELLKKWAQFRDREDLEAFLQSFQDLCIWRNHNKVAFQELMRMMPSEDALDVTGRKMVREVKMALERERKESAFLGDVELLKEYQRVKDGSQKRVVQIVDEDESAAPDSTTPLTIPMSSTETDAIMRKGPGVHHLFLEAALDANGCSMRTPVIVVKGSSDGPTVGLFCGLEQSSDTVTYLELLWQVANLCGSNPTFRGRLIILPNLNSAIFTPSHNKHSSYVHWCDKIFAHVAAHCEIALHLSSVSHLACSTLYTLYGDLHKPHLRRDMYSLEPNVLVSVKFFENYLLKKVQENGVGCMRIEYGESGRRLTEEQCKHLRESIISLFAQLNMLPQEESSVVKQNSSIPLLCSGFTDFHFNALGGVVVSERHKEAREERIYSAARVLCSTHDLFGRTLSTIQTDEDCVLLWCKEGGALSGDDCAVCRVGTLRSFFHDNAV